MDQKSALISDKFLLNVVEIDDQDKFLEMNADALVFFDKRQKLNWFQLSKRTEEIHSELNETLKQRSQTLAKHLKFTQCLVTSAGSGLPHAKFIVHLMDDYLTPSGSKNRCFQKSEAI